MASKTVTQPSLAEQIAKADIAELDAQIEREEQELAKVISAAEGRIAALKTVRKAASLFQHGKPERKKPGPRKKKESAAVTDSSPQSNGQQLTLKERIRRYLEVNSGAKPAIIAADVMAPAASVSATLSQNRNLFTNDSEGRWMLRRD